MSRPPPGYTLRVLRDPLTHLVSLTVVVFVAHGVWAPSDDTERTLVIPSSLVVDAPDDQGGRAADDQQTLARWKTEEVMYTEALRLGLHQNDSTLRKHLIAKARKALLDAGALPEPSEAELKAWLKLHRASYLTPTRYDFEQAGMTTSPTTTEALARARAEALREQMALGATAPSTSFEQQTFKQIARRFTPAFATQLIRSRGWQALRSPEGWHVVKLTGTKGGELPPMRELRPRLRSDWQRANREKLGDRAVQSAARDYVFVDETAPSPKS